MQQRWLSVLISVLIGWLTCQANPAGCPIGRLALIWLPNIRLSSSSPRLSSSSSKLQKTYFKKRQTCLHCQQPWVYEFLSVIIQLKIKRSWKDRPHVVLIGWHNKPVSGMPYDKRQEEDLCRPKCVFYEVLGVDNDKWFRFIFLQKRASNDNHFLRKKMMRLSR